MKNCRELYKDFFYVRSLKIKDAAINSLKGTAYGKEFVRRHGAYLIDYFYKCTREYDF